MMQVNNTTLNEGQIGSDAGHEFKIRRIAGNEYDVQIEYLSDGKRVWFGKEELAAFDFEEHY